MPRKNLKRTKEDLQLSPNFFSLSWQIKIEHVQYKSKYLLSSELALVLVRVETIAGPHNEDILNTYCSLFKWHSTYNIKANISCPVNLHFPLQYKRSKRVLERLIC